MSERDGTPAPSAALLAAQKRLLALRQARGVSTTAVAQSAPPPPPARTPLPWPTHLGWHSPAVSAALRRLTAAPRPSPPPPPALRADASVAARPPEPAPATATIAVYPDIALALLREDQCAAGRLWLLLRHLDREGRGWLPLSAVRRALTDPHAPYRLCGPRQLRHLLQAGEGRFWLRTRAPHRLWLRGTALVAASLGVRRLQARAVGVEVGQLCQGIAQARAQLYATFHSARHDDARPARPIARLTLARLSGASRQSQRNYERRAGVRPKVNFAVHGRATRQAQQELGWRQRRALFNLCDHQGRQGAPGARLLAWQIPNSYTGPHARRRRGCQKRTNRQLADLFMKGITGNDAPEIAIPDDAPPKQKDRRRYFGNGRLAGRALSQPKSGDLFWPDHGVTSLTAGRPRFWHCFTV